MKTNRKRQKQFLCNFERFMYKGCIFIIVILIVGIVFGQTSLAKINLEVQKLNKEVEKDRNVNDSLEMKIDEMTSLDRIKQISEQYGLKYNSDNIKSIS